MDPIKIAVCRSLKTSALGVNTHQHGQLENGKHVWCITGDYWPLTTCDLWMAQLIGVKEEKGGFGLPAAPNSMILMVF